MLSLALSCVEADSPTRTMMKLVSRSSVAVSLGSRAWKRMTPSSATTAPTTMTAPRTSSPLAKIEPRIENWATTTSPSRSANRTTKNSGRLPSVDCRTPVAAGPKCRPTSSVATDTTQASPASARAATANAGSAAAPA